jgi:hypothetical protein
MVIIETSLYPVFGDSCKVFHKVCLKNLIVRQIILALIYTSPLAGNIQQEIFPRTGIIAPVYGEILSRNW